ncbi:MAG: SDR family NAD(P)-dependent oxidoreductase [Spirochaetota bacterium]
MGNRSCALVTGASMGLGKAFARLCAARGKDLLLVALPRSGLPELAGELAARWSIRVVYLEADLTESGVIEKVAELLRSRGLRLDLAINNAGIGEPGTFSDFPMAYHEDTIALNITALTRLCRLAVAEFGERDGCGILNVASLGSLYPMPGMAVYSGTKSFVRCFTLALREELAGRVRVSVLCPNAFVTTPVSAAYIASCGLASRLACLSPERIALEGLDGLERGAATIYPGRFNALLALLARIAPHSLACAAVKHYWSGFMKDRPTLWHRSGAAL